jgi:hypothetical protein
MQSIEEQDRQVWIGFQKLKKDLQVVEAALHDIVVVGVVRMVAHTFAAARKDHVLGASRTPAAHIVLAEVGEVAAYMGLVHKDSEVVRMKHMD